VLGRVLDKEVSEKVGTWLTGAEFERTDTPTNVLYKSRECKLRFLFNIIKFLLAIMYLTC